MRTRNCVQCRGAATQTIYRSNQPRPVVDECHTPVRVLACALLFFVLCSYHALYLPEEWEPPARALSSSSSAVAAGVRTGRTSDDQPASALTTTKTTTAPKLYPVIVEYMGNGPWHDNLGDNSSGRPEDSNLGYGIGAGKRYVQSCCTCM